MAIPGELVHDFLKDAETLETPQLSEKYGMSHTTVKEWRLQLWREGKLEYWPNMRVKSTEPQYLDHLVIEGDVVVIADLEVPYHDEEVVSYAVAMGMKLGIKSLLIAGDFLANDAFSPFPREEDYPSLIDELVSGEAVITALFEWFDTIYYIKGNHEQRATRKKELEFLRLLQLLWGRHGKLVVSEYKWCHVVSDGKETLVEHPAQYRKVRGSLPQERAEIEGMDTLSGHTHHMSMTFTKDGKHVAGEIGHGTDPTRRYYMMVNGTTTHPKWIRGFAVIRRGYKYWFPIDFTDWDFWLGEVQLRKKRDREVNDD